MYEQIHSMLQNQMLVVTLSWLPTESLSFFALATGATSDIVPVKCRQNEAA